MCLGAAKEYHITAQAIERQNVTTDTIINRDRVVRYKKLGGYYMDFKSEDIIKHADTHWQVIIRAYFELGNEIQLIKLTPNDNIQLSGIVGEVIKGVVVVPVRMTEIVSGPNGESIKIILLTIKGLSVEKHK